MGIPRRIFLLLFVTLLASCSATPKLYLTTGDLSMEITQNAPYVTSVAYSPDGKSVVSGVPTVL